MTVSDAPDYQRAVVAPQQLLGTISGGTAGTFGLPANCEALIVHAPGGSVETLTSVVGTTTGTYYPFVALPISPGSSAGSVYVATVVPALDAAVTITVSDASNPWYVAADGSTRAGASVTPIASSNLSIASGELDIDTRFPGPDLNTFTGFMQTVQPAYDGQPPLPPSFTITCPPLLYTSGTIITPDTTATIENLSPLASNGMNFEMALFIWDQSNVDAIYLLGQLLIAPGTTSGTIGMFDMVVQQEAYSGTPNLIQEGDASIGTGGSASPFTVVMQVFGSIV